MNKELYDLMDWAGVEEIVYSESSDPHRILGPHSVKGGLLIQAFVPKAAKIEAVLTASGKVMEMEEEDENGFFACLFQNQNVQKYFLKITFEDGTVEETEDPYSFAPLLTDEDLKKFSAGTHYGIWEKMGAHITTADGVKGVSFAVWAPEAMRVSVVGDFNRWDGRRHQMRELKDSGVFEIFIPGLKAGELYKFEIKTRQGVPLMKADPYANAAELRPNTASVVADLSGYQWGDADWLEKRKSVQENDKDGTGKPISVYEVHLGSWMKQPVKKNPDGSAVNGSEFLNYRDIAVKLAAYVKEMHYTHVELMPVMEHPLDNSWGYQVTGYYAPTSRFGTPKDFMYFMDYMHREGIGVILDWVPAHFPRDAFALASFDGSHVYESADIRKREHPHWGTYVFDYSRPEVVNFLMANALYWLGMYHADGIRMDAVASMLYLDYGKKDGEWIPNIYGGHENLEAIDFIRRLNTACKTLYPDALLIAEESSAWPLVTESIRNDGLGFDYKWNMGWMNDFLDYMSYDPLYRGEHYGELTLSMLYQYSENFLLVLSHDEVVHGKRSLVNKMPGQTFEDKFANLRAAYGFMMTHPGKKLLFMGQEFAQMDEWNEDTGVEWDLLKYPIHRQMKDYMQALNAFYEEHRALWELDSDPAGFQWINCHSWKENVIAFLRKGRTEKDTLLIVCNFTPLSYPRFNIGVPYYGNYTEIFNSDSASFGGTGMGNSHPKTAKKMDVDDLQYGITVTMPPMCMMVFSCLEKEVPQKVQDQAGHPQAVSRTVAKEVPQKAQNAAAAGKEKPEEKKASEEKKTSAETGKEKPEVKKAPAETGKKNTASVKKPEVKKGKRHAKGKRKDRKAHK